MGTAKPKRTKYFVFYEKLPPKEDNHAYSFVDIGTPCYSFSARQHLTSSQLTNLFGQTTQIAFVDILKCLVMVSLVFEKMTRMQSVNNSNAKGYRGNTSKNGRAS